MKNDTPEPTSAIESREWDYACERAKRAKKYAEAMLGQSPDSVITTKDARFQNPLWQWENEVKGRFSGKVGGQPK